MWCLIHDSSSHLIFSLSTPPRTSPNVFDRLRIHPFFSFIIPLPTLVLGLLASFCLVTRGLETVLRLRFYVRTEQRSRICDRKRHKRSSSSSILIRIIPKSRQSCHYHSAIRRLCYVMRDERVRHENPEAFQRVRCGDDDDALKFHDRTLPTCVPFCSAFGGLGYFGVWGAPNSYSESEKQSYDLSLLARADDFPESWSNITLHSVLAAFLKYPTREGPKQPGARKPRSVKILREEICM